MHQALIWDVPEEALSSIPHRVCINDLLVAGSFATKSAMYTHDGSKLPEPQVSSAVFPVGSQSTVAMHLASWDWETISQDNRDQHQ